MHKIIHISEAFSIAAHGMALIAGRKARISGNEIAETLGFSKNHTSKIMQILVKHQLLDSERGPGGGFTLRLPAEKVSLLDIYRLIEGDYPDNFLCHHTDSSCPFKECIFGNITDKLSAEFKTYLTEKSIKDLIKD